MDTKTMLDNAATASQSRDLLDPATRGAVLRSIVQWMTDHPNYDDFYHSCFVDDLDKDPDYSR